MPGSSPPSSNPSDPSIPKLRAGEGKIIVEFDPDRGHAFTQLSSTYPLKLLSPRGRGDSVAIVYVLSYGGGLVGGDEVELEVDVREGASLMLLSQVRRSIPYLRYRWMFVLVLIFVPVGIHKSVQRQVHEDPLSHSRMDGTFTPEFTRSEIQFSDLSTHDRTRFKRRDALPSPRPRNML